MSLSDAMLRRLDQVEQELTLALSEYPGPITLDRLRFARSLVRFVKAHLESDGEATVPVLTEVDEAPKTASGGK